MTNTMDMTSTITAVRLSLIVRDSVLSDVTDCFRKSPKLGELAILTLVDESLTLGLNFLRLVLNL